MSDVNIPIPDLRFENNFRKSLRAYSKKDRVSATEELEPLEPITPGAVFYAIIKDQILMQFLQGFGTAVFFMLMRPYLKYLANSGFRWGRRLQRGIRRFAGIRR